MINTFQFTGPHNETLAAWLDVHGTYYAPIVIDGASGIHLLAPGIPREIQWVVGDGPTDVTADPQIDAGVFAGQELYLIGTDDNAMVILHNGRGLTLNGACSLVRGAAIYLVWDGLTWNEVMRNDI